MVVDREREMMHPTIMGHQPWHGNGQENKRWIFVIVRSGEALATQIETTKFGYSNHPR